RRSATAARLGAGVAGQHGRPARRRGVLSVIGVNVPWLVDSLVGAAAGWFDLTTVRPVGAAVQAAVVAGPAVAGAARPRRARTGRGRAVAAGPRRTAATTLVPPVIRRASGVPRPR